MARSPLTLLAALVLSCSTMLWSADEAATPPATPATATVAATSATPAATTDAAAAAPAAAAPAPTKLDTGNTAWMLTATALVLLMTIPGLFLFYGGLVRSKNALSVMMQCFAITCVVTLLWLACGYSLAFNGTGKYVGDFGKAFFMGVEKGAIWGTYGIPESLFFCFQATFAIITPALIVGAFAERMKFSALLIFSSLWLLFVYAPIAHMVWGGGVLGGWGVLDFAGGTVVHINAGVAGLVCALFLGKRKGYPERAIKPHNLAFSVVGASLLWVGWFGFNAGSELMADDTASMAMLVTQVATASAALAWMFAEWIVHGKPSVLGIISGAVAGLVAITPASGTAGPVGAVFLGLIAGVACFISVAYLKKLFKYDDSLDAFGVHGVGGFVGAVLTGLFAAPALGGFGTVGTGADGTNSIVGQLIIQVEGSLVTVIYTAIVTAIILLIVKAIVGLKVTPDEEEEGLDLSQHGEEAYSSSN